MQPHTQHVDKSPGDEKQGQFYPWVLLKQPIHP
jgi:hypothetical protein